MSERLELDVDFRTQQAAQNVKTLEAALDALDKKTTETIRSMNAAEEQLAETGKAEDKLAESAKKATSAQDKQAATTKKASVEIIHANEQTSKLSSATDMLAGSVKAWLGSYAGASAIIRIIGELNQRMERALEIQKQLVKDKWGLDVALKSVKDNLQLVDNKSGSADDQARRIAIPIAKATSMPLEAAANLIGSAASLGYDVRNKAQRQSVVDIGQFANRVRLTGANELDALFKTVNAGKAQGYSEQQILSILNAAGTAVGASNPQEFNSGLLAGVAPALAQGVDLRKAVTQYGALVSVAPSTREGADLSRMLYVLAQTTQPEARARVAKMFGRTGKLSAPTVTSSDLEAAIAGEGEDAQAIRTMREELSQIETAAPLQDAAFETDLAKQRRSGKISQADIAARRQLRRETTIRDREQRVARLREDLSQRTMKVRSGIEGGRLEDSWRALPLDQRVEMLKNAASDPEGQALLLESLGGRHEMLRALVMASSPDGRAREAAVRSAIYDPASEANYQRVNRSFMGGSEAINASIAADEAGRNAEVVQPGDEYARRLLTQIVGEDGNGGEYNRLYVQGKLGAGLWHSREGITLTTTGAQDAMLGDAIMQRAKDFAASLSPEDAASFDLSYIESIVNNVGTMGQIGRRNRLMGAAQYLGKAMEAKKKREYAPQQSESPAMGTQSSASPVINYNFSPGNMWMSPGPNDEFDFSGFDRFG